MHTKRPSPETVIIPVTGVCNLELGPLSTASVHMGLLLHQLRSRTTAPVTRPITPSGLGLFDTPATLQARFANDVEQVTKPFPDAQRLYVAYSLGSVLTADFIARHDKTANLFSVAGPHGEVPNIPFSPFGQQVDAINEFIRATPGIMPRQEGGPHVVQLAVNHDELVPVASALGHIPFAKPERHILVDYWSTVPKAATERNATVHRTFLPHDHINVIALPESVHVITGLVSAMLQAEDSTLHQQAAYETPFQANLLPALN